MSSTPFDSLSHQREELFKAFLIKYNRICCSYVFSLNNQDDDGDHITTWSKDPKSI